jgi:putative transposon-encoded protein
MAALAGTLPGNLTESRSKGEMPMEVAMDKRMSYDQESDRTPVKFEVYGDVLIEKIVRQNGKGGRVYLPPDWVGKTIKIIK